MADCGGSFRGLGASNFKLLHAFALSAFQPEGDRPNLKSYYSTHSASIEATASKIKVPCLDNTLVPFTLIL
jgi:hypothetical protein